MILINSNSYIRIQKKIDKVNPLNPFEITSKNRVHADDIFGIIIFYQLQD